MINKSLTENKIASKSLNGAGSCILYAVLKLTHCSNKDYISLFATGQSMNFYKKLGLDVSEKNQLKFFLEKSKFAAFEKALEKKYSIKPV